MTEFQAYEFTSVTSMRAWAAEPLLRRVRGRYYGLAWWRRVYGAEEPLLIARAARAAEHQGTAVAEAVLSRLREATCAQGRALTDVDRLRGALTDVRGLDVPRLIRDLDSPDVVWSVDADRSLARRRGCPFPTVLFRGPGGDRVIAGAQPMEAYLEAVAAVAPALAGALR